MWRVCNKRRRCVTREGGVEGVESYMVSMLHYSNISLSRTALT